MSALLELQWKFSEYLGLFLVHGLPTTGYKVTMGECWRTPQQCAYDAAAGIGIADSLHGDRLAVDLNCFKDGTYISDGSLLADLGAYWKSLDGDCRWGGDFKSRPDGNHFSLSPDGVRA